MAKKSTDEPPKDIPYWFVTYSDVVTLLMTFFILLLTFATNEPETFERMKVAVFGGSGANGIAGTASATMAKDSIVYRRRPRSSRLTKRGSEMPPMESDPSYTSLANGLAGLEETPTATLEESYSIELPLAMMATDDGAITPLGRQRLRMVATQLRQDTFRLQIQISDNGATETALRLAQSLVGEHSITPGKIGIGTAATGSLHDGSLRLVLQRRVDP